MTIKLILLKSGEDLITDISEMTIGNEEDYRVIGYHLTKPCSIRIKNPNLIDNENGVEKKTGFEVSLYPWIPLSADDKIPIPADWLVTMVEPTAKLKEMYIEDVINYGKGNNQTDSINKQSEFNKPD